MGVINVTTQPVERALAEMLARGQDLHPAMKVIGEAMVENTHERFRAKEAPDGTSWAPLSPVTADRKGHDRILEGESRQLARQISYEASGDGLEWGSPMIYAAMQHAGGQQSEFPHLWGDIPGRAFLGVSAEDEDEILEILGDYLAGRL